MDEWKKWLNADYAFSNNGEKIKKVVKFSYTLSLALFFIGTAIGLFGVLMSIFSGGFEYVWYVPFIIIVAVFLAPYLIYWSLSFVYGYGELVSNSYGNNGNGSVVETVTGIEKEQREENTILNSNKYKGVLKNIGFFTIIILVYCLFLRWEMLELFFSLNFGILSRTIISLLPNVIACILTYFFYIAKEKRKNKFYLLASLFVVISALLSFLFLFYLVTFSLITGLFSGLVLFLLGKHIKKASTKIDNH